MKKIFLHRFLIAVGIFSLLVSCGPSPVVAKISRISGEVRVNGKPALAGAELRSQDRIEVVAGAYADLDFLNGHKTRLQTGKLQIEAKGRALSLRLSEGKMFVAVRKLGSDESLVIYTPSSVAGIRGTQFVVEEKKSDKESGTYIGVVEGAVEVSTRADRKKTVLIKKNQDLLIAPKKPLPIPKNNPALAGQMIQIFGEMGVLRPVFKSKDDDSARDMSGGLR